MNDANPLFGDSSDEDPLVSGSRSGSRGKALISGGAPGKNVGPRQRVTISNEEVKGHVAINQFSTDVLRNRIQFVECDLLSFASVKKAVERIAHILKGEDGEVIYENFHRQFICLAYHGFLI